MESTLAPGNGYSHVVVSAENHAEAHVNDTHYHRHLHLIGVQKREAVDGQVPNLFNDNRKKRQTFGEVFLLFLETV